MKPTTTMGPDLTDPAEGCLCFALRKATRALTQRYNQALAPSGLTATQFTLLTTLDRAGPLPLGGLARLLVTDRTTLTRNTALLEKAGLVATKPDADDRRRRALDITGRGRQRLRAARPLWREVQAATAARLGAGPARALLAALADVTDRAAAPATDDGVPAR